MYNERHAGRKSKITDEQLPDIRARRAAGVSVTELASEYGVSRQAMSKRLKDADIPPESRLDYYVDGELCTSIYIDRLRQTVRVVNYAPALSHRAFGYNESPDIHDLHELLEDLYLRSRGVRETMQYLLEDDRRDIDILTCVSRDGSVPSEGCGLVISEGSYIPRFVFSQKDRILYRTDTDGFQIKAITRDRRHFVKSQAYISGIAMRDWAVEIIACDLCGQLSIPCVVQSQCRFVYEGRSFDGVRSDNFELDGYTFISFESLLERGGMSSSDREFISLNSIDKLKWCADRLSQLGMVPHEQAIRYMLNLALIDCLVGNIDRHTRNFGLFFNAFSGTYEIPPLFDNGMGLFENDPYRDRYESFDDAMRNVYVSPYGEDPFDMLRLLDEEFDLCNIYPGLTDIRYPDILSTHNAIEYEHRIISCLSTLFNDSV